MVSSEHPLQIESEIGRLQKVMLHRPGRELERIIPGHLTESLFEDIPWLRRMQEEHDGFARLLQANGVEVHYIEDLLKDVLHEASHREQLLKHILETSENCDKPVKRFLTEYLRDKSVEDFTDFLIGGVTKEDIKTFKKEKSLSDYIKEEHFFYVNPLPNLYFMRDPAMILGRGIAIGAMYSEIRKRESQFFSLLNQHHPVFASVRDKTYYEPTCGHSVEGGGSLVLSKDTLAIGCSQRTGVAGIEQLADRLLNGTSNFKKLVVIQIPKNRAYMHLDTVFTMVDTDKFTVYPGILERVNVITVTKGQDGYLDYCEEEGLKEGLKKQLNLPYVCLIPGGGEDEVVAAREQWNDGVNTFALKPGTVFAY
ncbi:MAG TPA: arginine deiminase, partial [Eubacteriaceae bacterium]|nr:arginine deiminase [Eubacteriaceae bacterium]